MKPKVLLLTDWYTPGFRAGGPIRSCANLVAWLGNEVDFSVITTDRDWGIAQPYPGIARDQWTLTPEGTRVFYASPSFLSKANLEKLIRAEQFDFLFLNSMYSRPFTIWPLQLFAREAEKKFRILLAPRGMLRPGALKIKALKKKIFLRLFKWKGWQNRVTFVSTGTHESEDVRRVFGSEVKLAQAANLPEPIKETFQPLQKKNGEAVFISIGRIAKVKNTLQAIRIFRNAAGNARLDLYGPMNEPEYWKECEAGIKQLPPGISAEWKGELEPARVAETLAGAHFFVMCSVSENFGHAIYEALAHGKPVLIGDQTPWRGLEAQQAGWDLPVNDLKAFENAVQSAIQMDQQTYERWSHGAAEFAKRFMNADELLKSWRMIFGVMR